MSFDICLGHFTLTLIKSSIFAPNKFKELHSLTRSTVPDIPLDISNSSQYGDKCYWIFLYNIYGEPLKQIKIM